MIFLLLHIIQNWHRHFLKEYFLSRSINMKKKILIVEDEIIIAMELQSYLEKIGYSVLPIETN